MVRDATLATVRRVTGDPRLRPMRVLVSVALAGLIVMAVVPQLRPWVLVGTVMALDAAGAMFSWHAARGSATGALPWRLVAAGRGAAVTASAAFLVAWAAPAAPGWWWVGTVAQLSVFVLLAGGVLVGSARQLSGRRRYSLLTEVAVVVAAGFMVVWYIVLEPTIAHHDLRQEWLPHLGLPLGDLLLFAAAASVVLCSAVVRFAAPIAVLAAGLIVYLLSDVARWDLHGSAHLQVVASFPVASAVVAGSLLLTVAPVIAVCGLARTSHLRRNAAGPAWATHMPPAAMVIACALTLTVTVIEGEMLPWGGLVCGLVAMSAAVAARLQLALRDSRDQVVCDPLTRLANRIGLDDAIARAAKRGESAALLLIDLDGFKLVNDRHGHAAGDTVLITFANVLRSAIRSPHTAARLGGDEFAVLLPGVTHPDEATAVAARILELADDNAVRFGDELVTIRASIGVAVGELHRDGKDLIRHADLAMYHSKRNGSHGHTLHEPSMIDRRADDAALTNELDHALDNDELHVVYQPIVDLNDGRLLAVEALLRWQHPIRGLVSPARFIPLAERSGAINRIGLWVLEQALTHITALNRQRNDVPPVHVSVNVSPRQLGEPTLIADILATLRRTGTDPRHLILEITESALVEEATGIAALRHLRSHGIRTAVDDFGTGYSSLQYLTRLPVDILKIDRSFVGELNGTTEGAAVTDAIIRLAHVLHLRTVAEGVETTEQAAELHRLGCDTGQGYLYAAPLTAAALDNLVTAAVNREPSNVGRA